SVPDVRRGRPARPRRRLPVFRNRRHDRRRRRITLERRRTPAAGTKSGQVPDALVHPTLTRSGARPMKAFVHERYGPASASSVGDVADPVIGDDGVLVRVRASSLNAVDWHLMTGRPYLARLGEGLRKPKNHALGLDVAGVVEAVGKDVTLLQPGDEVFGARRGAFAALVAGRGRNFVPKPAALTFEQAGALPTA